MLRTAPAAIHWAISDHCCFELADFGSPLPRAPRPLMSIDGMGTCGSPLPPLAAYGASSPPDRLRADHHCCRARAEPALAADFGSNLPPAPAWLAKARRALNSGAKHGQAI